MSGTIFSNKANLKSKKGNLQFPKTKTHASQARAVLTPRARPPQHTPTRLLNVKASWFFTLYAMLIKCHGPPTSLRGSTTTDVHSHSQLQQVAAADEEEELLNQAIGRAQPTPPGTADTARSTAPTFQYGVAHGAPSATSGVEPRAVRAGAQGRRSDPDCAGPR